MKFKVGDKVRVVKRSVFNHKFGSILIITKVSGESLFPYEASDDDGHVIGYDEDELELVERRNNMNCGTREEAELKELILKKDDNGYYLEATYEVDRLDGVYELTIPHIELPVNFHGVTIKEEYDEYDCRPSWFPIHVNHKVDLGFGLLPLKKVKDKKLGDYCYKEKLIRSKVQEMTLSEIEAKLGHKIKIVNEKEE